MSLVCSKGVVDPRRWFNRGDTATVTLWAASQLYSASRKHVSDAFIKDWSLSGSFELPCRPARSKRRYRADLYSADVNLPFLAFWQVKACAGFGP